MSAIIAAPDTLNLTDQRFTLEEYLRLEQKADYKSEYLNGRVYATPGADESHVTIANNLIIDIGSGFRARRRDCRIFGSDMRVMIEATGLLTYPDISVACSNIRYVTNMRADTLLNPMLLVEILSDSTQRYDRGRKFDHYRQILTLQEYVLVSQYKQQVEFYTREGESGDAWKLRIFTHKDDLVPLQSIDAVLTMKKIYAKVVLTEEPAVSDENEMLPA